MTERLLRPREVAEILGVRRETIYAWIASGDLKHFDIGSGEREPRWRIRREDLDEFIARRESRARMPRRVIRGNTR